MIMEFKKSRILYFVLLFLITLVAVLSFFPITIGGFSFWSVLPHIEVKNKFLRVLAAGSLIILCQNLAAMACSKMGNKTYEKLADQLLRRCESKPVSENFKEAFECQSTNTQTALAKGILYVQALYAEGRYDDVLSAGEKTLEFSMNRANVDMYLTRAAIIKYMIMACCDKKDTAKAASLFAKLEEAVSYTFSDKDKKKEANKRAKHIQQYTRNYITFHVSKTFDNTIEAGEELSYAHNTYEKILANFFLARLYERGGDTEKARECYEYVANTHSDFAFREQAKEALSKFTPALGAKA